MFWKLALQIPNFEFQTVYQRNFSLSNGGSSILTSFPTICLVIFLEPVMLLVPQSSPGKLVSGAHNLLALLFFLPFLSFPLCLLLFLPPPGFQRFCETSVSGKIFFNFAIKIPPTDTSL